jgi:transposase-like protein
MSYTQETVNENARSPLDFARWLIDEQLIHDAPRCHGCRRYMSLRRSRSFKRDRCEWKCNGCRRRRSIRTGSQYLDHGNLSVVQQTRLGIAFDANATALSTSKQWGISRQTIGAYFQRYRQLVSTAWQARIASGEQNFTGGVVEADCMTIVDCYDNVNRVVVPVCHIFGLLEVPTGRVRLFRVANQQQATLLPLIQQVVPHGSIIMTDSHKAFWNLQELPYYHFTVNHSAGDYAHDDVDLMGNNIRVTTNHIEQVWARFRPFVRCSHQRFIAAIDLSMDVFSHRDSGHSLFDVFKS